MAYEKLNTPYTWIDEEDGKTTPISSEKLNEKEATLDAIDNRLIDVAEMVEALASDLTGEIENVREAVSDVENKVSEVEDKAYENYELIYSLREETKEAIEELQEADNNIEKSISDISDELATLSQDKASAITETSKGESISAKGTVGGNNIQLLGIHGKYEQDGEPTPNNPIEIKKSVVSEVKTHRKNHLDCRGLSEFVSTGFTFTPVYKDQSKEELLYINVNGTWNTSSTATNVRMKLGVWYPKEAGDYVLSGMTYLGANSWLSLDKNGDSGGYEVTATTSRNFTVDEDAEFYDVWLRIESGLTVNNAKIYPMIRRADIADATYEPYTESKATLSSPIELGGIGEVADVLDAKEIKRRFATFEPTPSMFGKSSNTTVDRFVLTATNFTQKPKVLGLGMCNMFVWKQDTNNGIGKCWIDGNLNFLCDVSAYGETTLEQFRELITATPIIIHYELAEPTTEALPTADQIALNSLKSFDGVTYVETDSEVKPIIEVECVLDTKAYIDRKFAELQAVLTAE